MNIDGVHQAYTRSMYRYRVRCGRYGHSMSTAVFTRWVAWVRAWEGILMTTRDNLIAECERDIKRRYRLRKKDRGARMRGS